MMYCKDCGKFFNNKTFKLHIKQCEFRSDNINRVVKREITPKDSKFHEESNAKDFIDNNKEWVDNYYKELNDSILACNVKLKDLKKLNDYCYSVTPAVYSLLEKSIKQAVEIIENELSGHNRLLDRLQKEMNNEQLKLF